MNAPVGDTQHTALAGSLLTTTQALTVVDAETGVKFYDNDTTQLRSFIGVYGLFDNTIDDTAGVRGRVEARMYDQVWLGGFIENDDQFDTTGGFTCELRLGRRGTRSSSCCLASRSATPCSAASTLRWRRKRLI